MLFSFSFFFILTKNVGGVYCYFKSNLQVYDPTKFYCFKCSQMFKYKYFYICIKIYLFNFEICSSKKDASHNLFVEMECAFVMQNKNLLIFIEWDVKLK